MSKLNKPATWKKQVNPNTNRMKQLMRDVRADTVRLTRNSKDLDQWLEKLAPYTASNCFITGVHADTVRDIVQQITNVVNQTSLPSGANAEMVKGTMAEKCMTMVTNVGETIKNELRQIAVESYNNRLAPAETAKVIGEKIDSLSKTRCEAIARTETCRAANIANYLNAKEMGAKSYSVICNEDCCEYCEAEYGGNSEVQDVGTTVYDIEDTDNLPPLHPNCRCTPVWSMDPVESDGTTEEEIPDETGIESDSNTMFSSKYQEYSEDSRDGTKLIVREYENGLKLAVEENSKFTHDEIVKHIETLPEGLRNIKELKRIDFTNREATEIEGYFLHFTKKITIFDGGISKEKALDTFNHELAHAFDHSNGDKNNVYGLSLKEVYDKIFKADDRAVVYTNEEGEKLVIHDFPTKYAEDSYERKIKYWEDEMVQWNKNGRRGQEPEDLRYIEDFAESTRLYLNPRTHDDFVKRFPNRAKYLKELYGKPDFDKNPFAKKIKEEMKGKEKLANQFKNVTKVGDSYEYADKKRGIRIYSKDIDSLRDLVLEQGLKWNLKKS